MNKNKRQKVGRKCEQPEYSRSSTSNATTHQTYSLDTLPLEVIEMVLKLLPLDNVAYSVRLVSKRCSIVATTVLNSAFLAAGAKIERAMSKVESSLVNAKSNYETLSWSRSLNVLELIRAQYKMLKAVTWRYTHPPNQRTLPRMSFYAGALLDELHGLLFRAVKNPSTFADSRDVNSDVTFFIALCKRFMDFFEKITERAINRSALVSGCKIVDVLDCLIEGRQVLSFKESPSSEMTNGTVDVRLKYVMKRTWFTCLKVSKPNDEKSWRDEQRFMYLRLRRLVGSVNEHLFENLHYEKELVLEVPFDLSLKSPPASTYSGYGEYGGLFFYYGNMNKNAFKSKFAYMNQPTRNARAVDSENEVSRVSPFDLIIEIELQCSSDLAPLAVRNILKSDELETFSRKPYRHPEISLKMNITCSGLVSNRLPSNFIWEVQSPRLRPKS